MRITDFTDERIAAVREGAALSAEERSFLIEDTARFEECILSADELAGLSDADLMREAYHVWAEYASCL